MDFRESPGRRSSALNRRWGVDDYRARPRSPERDEPRRRRRRRDYRSPEERSDSRERYRRRERSSSRPYSYGGRSVESEDDRRTRKRRRRSRSYSYDRRYQEERRYQRYDDERESSYDREQRPGRYYDDERRRRRRRRRRDRRSPSSSASAHDSPVEQPLPRAGVVSVEEDAGVQQERGPDNNNLAVRSPSVHDDTVGHYQGGPGSIIADRYRFIRQVGLGTFGRVVECLDLKFRSSARDQRYRRDAYVAIKIVRNVKRYHESALIEARIVQDVNRRGGRGLTHCVVMHNSFSFQGHYCMVFESLGPSLYDFLKKYDYKPFPMVCIQDFTVQLLETLEFLHSFRLIHTDLKIENVLLMNDREVTYANQRVPESTRIKVIDFGGACYDNDKKSSVINTRQYRAPEVILGTGWSMPSDVWSLGCILAELYQGELLFATHDNLEHLALIERIIGSFPRRVLDVARSSSDLAGQAFSRRGYHRLDHVLPEDSAAFVQRAHSLETIICNRKDSWFLDLLRRMLVIDPEERSTAHECLQFLSRIPGMSRR